MGNANKKKQISNTKEENIKDNKLIDENPKENPKDKINEKKEDNVVELNGWKMICDQAYLNARKVCIKYKVPKVFFNQNKKFSFPISHKI